MSKISKIAILILIIMSFFFMKEKFGGHLDKINFKIPEFKKIEFKKDKVNKQEKIIREVEDTNQETTEQKKEEKEYVWVYFLALDSEDNGIYKKVKRELPPSEDKLEFAIKELLKGPNLIEKATGAYSEIPQNTKLLKITESGNKIIIDFSSDFEVGGGTDSIYSRMMQLVKTSINNTDNKKIYLYLNGKQVNFLGGEGIMITQPLSERSLEV